MLIDAKYSQFSENNKDKPRRDNIWIPLAIEQIGIKTNKQLLKKSGVCSRGTTEKELQA